MSVDGRKKAPGTPLQRTGGSLDISNIVGGGGLDAVGWSELMDIPDVSGKTNAHGLTSCATAILATPKATGKTPRGRQQRSPRVWDVDAALLSPAKAKRDAVQQDPAAGGGHLTRMSSLLQAAGIPMVDEPAEPYVEGGAAHVVGWGDAVAPRGHHHRKSSDGRAWESALATIAGTGRAPSLFVPAEAHGGAANCPGVALQPAARGAARTGGFDIGANADAGPDAFDALLGATAAPEAGGRGAAVRGRQEVSLAETSQEGSSGGSPSVQRNRKRRSGRGNPEGGTTKMQRLMLRKERNRESAARSRARRQAYLEELEKRLKELEKENEELASKLLATSMAARADGGAVGATAADAGPPAARPEAPAANQGEQVADKEKPADPPRAEAPPVAAAAAVDAAHSSNAVPSLRRTRTAPARALVTGGRLPKAVPHAGAPRAVA